MITHTEELWKLKHNLEVLNFHWITQLTPLIILIVRLAQVSATNGDSNTRIQFVPSDLAQINKGTNPYSLRHRSIDRTVSECDRLGGIRMLFTKVLCSFCLCVLSEGRKEWREREASTSPEAERGVCDWGWGGGLFGPWESKWRSVPDRLSLNYAV